MYSANLDRAFCCFGCHVGGHTNNLEIIYFDLMVGYKSSPALEMDSLRDMLRSIKPCAGFGLHSEPKFHRDTQLFGSSGRAYMNQDVSPKVIYNSQTIEQQTASLSLPSDD